jgi:hypothetical protein
MDTLALKLVLTPLLIGGASLAGRRWGPGVSGWLVGFPFTSAPIALFLALGHGPDFAATAALGTMAGAISQAAFCVVYGHLARSGWPRALAAACLAFAASTAALDRIAADPLPLFGAVVAALLLAFRVMPAGAPERPGAPAAAPPWDIPSRMIVATGFVLLLTGIASALGPQLTGLLAPFPLYGAVLAVFAHHLRGAAAASAILRGLLLGLYAFAGFFLVLAWLLGRTGLAMAFTAATAVTFAIQSLALLTLRRTQRSS